VFCQPGAARSAVLGLHGCSLKVKVRAKPVDGRANAELLTLLAAKLDVSRSCLRLLSGEQSRNKRILAAGADVDVLAQTLQAVLGEGTSA
jgi:uncharacterized protein (TIGR00251 family)